jgi:hypothetical protein
MHCRFCGSPLQPIHGHEACLRSGCPMFGVVQGDCCQGDGCEAPVLRPVPAPEKPGTVDSEPPATETGKPPAEE